MDAEFDPVVEGKSDRYYEIYILLEFQVVLQNITRTTCNKPSNNEHTSRGEKWLYEKR